MELIYSRTRASSSFCLQTLSKICRILSKKEMYFSPPYWETIHLYNDSMKKTLWLFWRNGLLGASLSFISAQKWWNKTETIILKLRQSQRKTNYFLSMDIYGVCQQQHMSSWQCDYYKLPAVKTPRSPTFTICLKFNFCLNLEAECTEKWNVGFRPTSFTSICGLKASTLVAQPDYP